MRAELFFPKELYVSIIDDTAKKLNCKSTEVFKKVADSLGYGEEDCQVDYWISRYIECRFIPEVVVDWCLEILVSELRERLVRHPEMDGKVLKGGL